MKLNSVSKWLISLNVLILVMIVIGGITRLTGAGLSMVDWRPIFGILPPLNETQWMLVFNQYKQFPEYQNINSHLTLIGFKKIFFWEYLHRILGRIIGLVAIIPYFVLRYKNVLSSLMKRNGVIIIFWVIIQGLVGWYMVKSGLTLNPHVSHLRLAFHLLLAFGLFAFIHYQLLCLNIKHVVTKYDRSIFGLAIILLLLIFSQINYGAFVSGLKAGYAYTTFPKMGGEWMPDVVWMMTPMWRNFIDNPFMVQFVHRCLAWVIWLSSLGFYLYLRQHSHFHQVLASRLLFLFVTLQFLLGVATLVMAVPITLAVCHQLNAVFVLAASVYLCFSLKKT